MGTNGSQAAARGAAFNLIVLRSRRDRDQWYSTLIPRPLPPPLPPAHKTYDYAVKKNGRRERDRDGETEREEGVGGPLSSLAVSIFTRHEFKSVP